MTAAAPPMSEVMWCIDAAGFIEMPPVSKVMPLPTSATFFACLGFLASCAPRWISRTSRCGRDEPVDAAVAAAALIPEIDLLVTGRLENLAPELAESASPNVSFVGFLPAARYQMLVAEADLVVALTTEPTSVMRSAYEAVYARRPLVISDWPLCRELFPFAVAVANDPASIAEGLRRAVDNLRALEDQAENARRLQAARWESQLAALVSVLGLPRPDTA